MSSGIAFACEGQKSSAAEEKQAQEQITDKEVESSEKQKLIPPRHPLAKDKYKLKKDSTGKGMFD